LVSIINLKNNYEKEKYLKEKIYNLFNERELKITKIDFNKNKNLILMNGEYYNSEIDENILKEKIKKLENKLEEKYKEKIKLEFNLNLIKKIKN
jgi:hypothetical protein